MREPSRSIPGRGGGGTGGCQLIDISSGEVDGGRVQHIQHFHESKESWEKFRDDILLPRLQQGIEGGFTTAPEETVVDLYQMLP